MVGTFLDPAHFLLLWKTSVYLTLQGNIFLPTNYWSSLGQPSEAKFLCVLRFIQPGLFVLGGCFLFVFGGVKKKSHNQTDRQKLDTPMPSVWPLWQAAHPLAGT